ncbi:hypothetical protein BDV96DRAFT_61405 [Lophiotrema nucula]|uniref:TauD/TfdA-like domain-containing protein n=1 Tax=Lophiotrema nucula TaxID=690887 RepID=A0A6A5ZBY6_9PLEO|nr:hypothetical protein BDV96DRAFT_61405 [Lophiotrema nucula]
MLSNTWNIYNKTFERDSQKILRATIERRSSSIPATSAARADDSSETIARFDSRESLLAETVLAATPGSTFEGSPRIHVPSTKPIQSDMAPRDRTLFSDAKTALNGEATRSDLTDSIGTLLSDIQLSSLTSQQLDELALLVSERGVVFVREQDLTTDDQTRIAERLGSVSGGKESEVIVKRETRKEVEDEGSKFAPWPQIDWHAEEAFQAKPPSYSLLRIEEGAQDAGATFWVSQYGLYDSLSEYMRNFLDGLHTQTQNPAVRTHPVTGLKALNVFPGLTTRLAELKKKESDNFLQFLDYHVHSAADHTVRFKWASGSVAVWDNRCVAHRHVPSGAQEAIAINTTVLSEKPYFDSASESREERAQRLAREPVELKESPEVVKRRYNRTPLRRIIQRQVLGEEAVPTPAIGRITTTKSESSHETTLVSDSIQSLPPKVEETEDEGKKERTEAWAEEVTKETLPPKKKPIRVSNTPLRRIIQRQVSASA